MIHRYLWQALKLFFPTLKRQTSYSAHHTSLDLSRRLLTITAWWLPWQHFPEIVRNLRVIHKTFSFLHYPPLPKLCSYYPRCLMVTTSSVSTHLGLCTSGIHTHANRFALARSQQHHIIGMILQMWCRQIERFKSSLNVNYKHNIFVLNAEYMLNSCRLSLPFSLLCCTALHSPKWETQKKKVVCHSRDILMGSMFLMSLFWKGEFDLCNHFENGLYVVFGLTLIINV